jgi:A/G-specific adenine glycosylase
VSPPRDFASRATAPAGNFASRIISWQRLHGRSHLPWQGTRDPYRVWLSEIMLQQTQVSSVLQYYPRFLQRFPDVASLAAAPQADVFALWSGLGYYSRARNLHRCAQLVMADHGGQFPASAEALQTLPGIGRSTAAAIAAFCWGERTTILDGNVKRVLTRVLGFAGDLAQAKSEQALWQEATHLLPPARLLAEQPDAMTAYTQGLMDLGASLCSRRSPACPQCPLLEICAAGQAQSWAQFPVKTRKLKRSQQSLWLLLARSSDSAVWLEPRPAQGVAGNALRNVWAGLHCLPVFDSRAALLQALPADCGAALRDAAVVKHALTHKDLLLHPVLLDVPQQAQKKPQMTPLMAGPGEWFAASHWPALGLPAPVRQLLMGLA